MSIRVLGISGSPRIGNSLFLLLRALEAAKNVDPDEVITEQFSFKGKKIGPCLSCVKCQKNGGECILQDDFMKLRDMWLEADVILYSVPVYHMHVPGQFKCFIDRLGNSCRGLHPDFFPRRLKVIGALAQGLDLFAGQESCQIFLLTHAALMNCLAVSGDGPESYIGSGGWTRLDLDRKALERLHAGCEEDARHTVTAAESLARRAIETAMIVKAGVWACRKRLSADPAYGPILEKAALEGKEF